MFRILALAALMLAHTGEVRAQQVSGPDHVGDTYEIRLSSMTESTTDDGSSSSNSRSGGLLIERVAGIRDDGLDLEFDLPSDARPEERTRDWQWPARVLKAPDGSLALLNAAELEARIEAWLTLGGMSREACGQWIFTWNAFKIECDPRTVIGTLGSYDLRFGDVREGAAYTEQGGVGPAYLRLESSGPEGSKYVVETPVDADFVRGQRAESDVVVAEIMGEPTTLEAALQARSDEQITGTIATTLTVDVAGRVTARTRITRLTITNAEGVTEHSTHTVSVERRRLAASET